MSTLTTVARVNIDNRTSRALTNDQLELLLQRMDQHPKNYLIRKTKGAAIAITNTETKVSCYIFKEAAAYPGIKRLIDIADTAPEHVLPNPQKLTADEARMQVRSHKGASRAYLTTWLADKGTCTCSACQWAKELLLIATS